MLEIPNINIHVGMWKSCALVYLLCLYSIIFTPCYSMLFIAFQFYFLNFLIHWLCVLNSLTWFDFHIKSMISAWYFLWKNILVSLGIYFIKYYYLEAFLAKGQRNLYKTWLALTCLFDCNSRTKSLFLDEGNGNQVVLVGVIFPLHSVHCIAPVNPSSGKENQL